MYAKLVTGAALMLIVATTPARAAPDWTAVGQALGRPGTEMPGGIYRIGLLRSDLKVTLDGVEIKPALALGSWLAFQAMGDQAMVMGDIVLTQDEVNPVMKRLAEAGIEITALHNHLLRAEPATMYMHVDGHGDPVKLAAGLRDALALSKTPPGTSAAAPAQAVELDTAALDGIIGHAGKANGGVYQFTIPRAETITDRNMPVPVSMGTGIAINFQPTGNGKAAITGDFVLIGSEVNPVLRALRENGIEVTAVHNHMLDDQPRLFFKHFWANDDAQKLAKGLRAALNQVKVARP
jgi:biotin operon repressor